MKTTVRDIQSLVHDLSNRDGLARQTARRSLVAMGEAAVAALAAALKDRNCDVRWEAAKALAEIASPRAGPALVRALNDRNFGVRWLGAEGLIALGLQGLPPLLRALVEDPDSTWLREGAHHVLSYLADQGLRDTVGPLLAVLEGSPSPAAVMVEADSLAQRLRPAAQRAKRVTSSKRTPTEPRPSE
jgi:HEAT repeat protein